MKVGDNIKEIRESEKNFKRSYVAGKLTLRPGPIAILKII